MNPFILKCINEITQLPPDQIFPWVLSKNHHEIEQLLLFAPLLLGILQEQNIQKVLSVMASISRLEDRQKKELIKWLKDLTPEEREVGLDILGDFFPQVHNAQPYLKYADKIPDSWLLGLSSASAFLQDTNRKSRKVQGLLAAQKKEPKKGIQFKKVGDHYELENPNPEYEPVSG